MKKMLKIIIIIAAVLFVIFLALGIIMFMGSQPIDKQTAIESIDDMVSKTIGKKNVTQAIVYVDSPSYGVNQVFAHGELNGKAIDENQPFHIASSGKAFTAALVGVLIDEGKISLDDKISNYLDDKMLANLFVYKGTDYKDQITVGNLLMHTSGVADYFEDDAVGSDKMQELIVNQPDKLWLPADLLDFTRRYQSAVSAPNAEYHYSDTGYILLGLIIESVSGKSFDAMLHEKIFTPLNMDDSYLMFYSEPANSKRSIADVHLADVNIADYNSLSIDWAGGGIISTAQDLAVFIRALNNHEIISESTLNSMYQFDESFMNGIHYGYGFMEYHFGEFFPTMNGMAHYTGHMGVLGVQMFYDKGSDTVYISSFGSTDYAGGSVQMMIKVLSTLERIK